MAEREYTPEIGRAIVDAGRYVTLATADDDGRPWASPVWFAHRDYREFFWISRPDVRHSTNLRSRAEVGLVVFDSTVSPGDAQAVYLEAVARQVPDDDLADAVHVYSARSVAQGLQPLTVAGVSGAAPFRMYVAAVEQSFLLGKVDRREKVPLDA